VSDYDDPGDQNVHTPKPIARCQDTIDMFGDAQSKAAKVEAVNRVERNADEEWMEVAFKVVVALSRARAEFTTDSVWRRLDSAPHEPRAMGAVMRRAARAGLCVKTDRVVESKKISNHRRPIAIWRSLSLLKKGGV
tara:strand:+ start:492 stop:899 length:408 start_codon:yes stop_codon:yes gene_type:complete